MTTHDAEPIRELISASGGRFARVVLSREDMDLGLEEAQIRQRFHRRKRSRDRIPTRDDQRALIELRSVRAEITVMRWTGAPIRFRHGPNGGPPDPRLPDVLPDIQVRWASKDYLPLTVRESDELSHRFVLVKGSGPTFELRGWLYGTEAAEHPGWHKSAREWGRPAWCAPERALRPMMLLAMYGERQA